MGVYASSFSNSDGPVGAHPNKANWITAHATASGLAVVEVERLWYRFQQLGCTDAGVLTSDVLTRPPASTDIFVKNILTTLRNARDPDYNIQFFTFLNAMTWAENTDVEKKIRAMFQLINNGSPISRDILLKVLKRLYPDESDRNLGKTADAVMLEMDPHNTGQIEEDRFVSRVQQLPSDSLESMLAFSIIPEDINAEAHRAFTNSTHHPSQSARSSVVTPSTPWGGGGGGGANTPMSISKQIPTDNKLRDIAQKIHKRDWQLLANKLGLTAQDVTHIQNTVGRDSFGQCQEMLKSWRNRAGAGAYAEVLEKALRESNMNDAAMLLQP